MNEPNELHVLTGPTASGKSAVGLALAELIGAEIISLDSMKVYRGMDLGTEKPSAEDKARVPHHLIDIREPGEDYDVRAFLADAVRVVDEIHSRGRAVLFEGGTVLYLRSLLEGLFEGPGADRELRARLEEEAKRDGTAALHQRLAGVDPVAAAEIHPHDLRRIVRALEVHELTGRPISVLRAEETRPPLAARWRVVVLEREREELYERINARVTWMFKHGLVEEVRGLASAGKGLGRSAAQALGYKEVLAALAGKYDEKEALYRVRRETRRFARKQISWLRRLVPREGAAPWGEGAWLRPEGDETPAATAERIARLWKLR